MISNDKPNSRSEADENARRIVEAIYTNDPYSNWLGMKLVSVTAEAVCISLKIEPHHMNAIGTGHGGVTFSLADSAFGYASNAANLKTMSLSVTINFTKAVSLGDTLIAEARAQVSGKRTGVYDITVHNQNNELVALLRGVSYQTSAPAVTL